MVPNRDPLEQFIDAVQRSGLVAQNDLQTTGDNIKSADLSSQEDVADKLVEKNVLTRFQADRILAGQGKDCILVERYHLLEQIGAGGMGHVFRALDTRLDRDVAIKVMASQSLNNADAVARFQREARALAHLDIPNVVKALDAGEDNGRHFLVMEYIDGIGLNALVQEKGPLSPSIAADYIYQTAVGMQHAHNKKLIHRDLKPGNLLLTKNGEIKILDLGLARFMQDQLPGEELTRENIGMGTPDYMPPEQFRDARNVDPRADIYSLGCTLYHLLAGRVPFPGSSFADKAHAHEFKEPPPLEECSPEVPAGLALTGYKMMEKRPEDRFQSMRETAEALMPYVAGSSPSLPSIKHTVSWSGSQLSTAVRRQRSRLPWLVGGLTVAVLVLLAVVLSGFWVPYLFPPRQEIARNKTQIIKPNPATPGGSGVQKPPPKIVPTDPNVLTVAQDGTAQFKKISDALAQVKPGQKILVVDNKVYSETLLINDVDNHKGITLETNSQAAIQMKSQGKNAVTIDNVTNVQLKGFRLVSPVSPTKNRLAFVELMGNVAGARLHDLHIEAIHSIDGIVVINCPIKFKEQLITIQKCHIKCDGYGIVISGSTARPSRSVLVAENVIQARTGIILNKTMSHIQITGNHIKSTWVGGAALVFDELTKTATDILIANNTIEGGATCVQINDDVSRLARDYHHNQVWFRNNILIHGGISDTVLLQKQKGARNSAPHDPSAIVNLWNFAHNWRDMAGENTHPIFPLMKDDHRLMNTHFVTNNKGAKHYLQPKKESPLATEGAGKTDAAFPIWVGAIPPDKAEPWNWQWTWDAHFHKTLTVSQDEKGKAQFKNINAALKKVQPGMTIRVLDKGPYEETVRFQDPLRHVDVTLEAANSATITPPSTIPSVGVLVQSVPGIKVRGFHLHAKHKSTFLVGVTGPCPGLILENIKFSANQRIQRIGIEFNNQYSKTFTTNRPMSVKQCTFQGLQIGIMVSGAKLGTTTAWPVSQILLHGNIISHCDRGIWAFGRVNDVAIVGNRIANCPDANVYVNHLLAGSGGILIANNTLLNSDSCISLEGPFTNVKDVEIRNNVLLALTGLDMTFKGKDRKDIAMWRIADNWRQVIPPATGGANSGTWVTAKEDKIVKTINLLSLDPNDPLFLHPPKNSPLAKAGAGTSDQSLPVYVGAVPPAETAARNWLRTWKMRMNKQPKTP